MEVQLRALGVRAGGVLVVHTSFREVRPVEGGPSGLIGALRGAIGPSGTLVMPTMTDGESVFDPRSTPTCDMGITAETFWRQPGVLRSTHPGGSFAAEGPLAERICAPQPLEPPHGIESPPGRAYELGAQILLLGVTHGEDTTLHVAESLACVPYRIEHPCVVAIDGAPRRVMIGETDHCCRGFRKMDAWLGDRQREGTVGSALAKLADARDIVAIALARLAEDPFVFLCAPSERCEECDAARASAKESSA
ncbi:MAG: AAC(3) family N-acetyltransferase [Labilithrix sp.]|nr:AAC(3) family N-acetyltransferase [Labilithrix sp.]